jgi:hypothetical protein
MKEDKLIKFGILSFNAFHPYNDTIPSIKLLLYKGYDWYQYKLIMVDLEREIIGGSEKEVYNSAIEQLSIIINTHIRNEGYENKGLTSINKDIISEGGEQKKLFRKIYEEAGLINCKPENYCNSFFNKSMIINMYEIIEE